MKEVSITNNTKIKMYKAFDTLDEVLSLFAIKGEEMAVSTYFGDTDPWITQEGFESVGSYTEPLDLERMQNPILLWES